MYMCAGLWDNDLVNQKEEQMKPIEITKQDVLGYMHTASSSNLMMPAL